MGLQEVIKSNDQGINSTEVSKVSQFTNYYQHQKIKACVNEFADVTQLFLDQKEPLTVTEILMMLPKSSFQVRKALKRMVGCGLIKKITFDKLYLFCFDEQHADFVRKELANNANYISA